MRPAPLMFAALALGPGLTTCASEGGDRPLSTEEARTACADVAQVRERPLRVVTTVAPITSIVADVTAGTDTEVVGLVPEGTNSHTFEPSPSQAAALADADIVILNGLQLEQPTRALADANAPEEATICELGTAVLPEDEYRFDSSFPDDGGKPNPHLWTDPILAADYAALVTDVLRAADPDDAATYAANLDAFHAKVDALDAAVRVGTGSVPTEQRLLLTYHDAYAYWAADYGWTVVGAIQPASFGEPTPQEVAELIEQIEDVGVRAVFGSEVFPSPVLEQIARESGATYVDDLRDDDLPGLPGEPDHSWLGLMRFNYVTMIEALGGDARALRALDTVDGSEDTATYPQ